MIPDPLNIGIAALFFTGILKNAVNFTIGLAMTRAGVIAIVILLLAEGWHVLGPEPRVLDGPRQAVADQAVEEAAGKIPYDKTIDRVAVINLERDVTSYITGALRSKIASTGRYIVCGKGFMARLREKLNLEPGQAANDPDAIRAAKNMGAGAVILGSVPELVQDDNSAQITLRVRMLRVSNAGEMASIEVKKSLSKSIISPGFLLAQAREKSVVTRLALWAMITIALPLLLAPIVRRVTRRDSNALNLMLLSAFVFVNLLAALFIVDVGLQTITGGIILVAVLALAVVYNYAICTRINELSR
ncbi:MAG: hypothetical protein NTY46_16745 [Candidatus Sumerlaeota bacterium]|nr:hypothetical protein [Candidatus Sumerlaeota bacterium]